MKGSVILPNKKTVALNKEQYELIIDTIRQGFIYQCKGKNVQFKPNNRMASVLAVQANLGLRIGDILKLKFNDIIKDGNRYRLDIIEEKTGKNREFTVTNEIYNYLKMYCLENNIKPTATIFPITERSLQKNLKILSEYLGIENISTHSFRKFYATSIYLDNGYNVALVRELLQHSTLAITQKYIGVSSKLVEEAIQNHSCLR